MTATLDQPAVQEETPDWRGRLQPLVHGTGGWGVTLLVTVVAGLLRFLRLDQPATTLTDKGVVEGPADIFDEVYYACDAWSLAQHGVEKATVPDAPFCTLTDAPAFVVHPPLGKWLIAIGERAFDFDTFGWRFSAAVIGTLTVLLVVRAGRRMTGSTLLGGLAGLLLALDGLHFVQSRVAMLDVFLVFWLVAAFAALLVDRDHLRARLAADLAPGWRPWRLVAGLCAGGAVATKWSALFVVAVLVLLALRWETGARRSAGVREPWPWRFPAAVLVGLALARLIEGPAALRLLPLVVLAVVGAGWEALARRTAGCQGGWGRTVVRTGAPFALALAVLPAVVYVTSWAGWFASDDGWSRTWADGRSVDAPYAPDALVSALPWDDDLRSLWHYHSEMYRFHSTLDASHPYQSHPLSWPFLGRPVSYYYPPGITEGRYGCEVDSCSREVLAIGTPALWWAMVPACIGLAARWASRRDWRAAALLAMTSVSILAWIPSAVADRTMFLFYALPSIPFLCLGLALLAGWVIGPPGARRRTWGAGGVGVYTSLVVINFALLYPVLAAVTIPYSDWRWRMWFDSWI